MDKFCGVYGWCAFGMYIWMRLNIYKPKVVSLLFSINAVIPRMYSILVYKRRITLRIAGYCWWWRGWLCLCVRCGLFLFIFSNHISDIHTGCGDGCTSTSTISESVIPWPIHITMSDVGLSGCNLNFKIAVEDMCEMKYKSERCVCAVRILNWTTEKNWMNSDEIISREGEIWGYTSCEELGH